MMDALEFGYAQARIQARLAALPPELEWERLRGVRGLGAYLEEARLGALGPWLRGFSALSGPHDVERGIRSLVWEQAQEVAAWVPRGWQQAVEWVGWIPLLAAFEELARGHRLPLWARQDPRLRQLMEGAEGAGQRDLDKGGLHALMSTPDAEQVASRWLLEWQARWPRMRRAATRPLDTFSRELRDHLGAFRQASPDTAWALRQRLCERLRLRLHQRLLQPLTAFLYLALVLLDLERLRGELLRRCLFTPGAPDLDAGMGVSGEGA